MIKRSHLLSGFAFVAGLSQPYINASAITPEAPGGGVQSNNSGNIRCLNAAGQGNVYNCQSVINNYKLIPKKDVGLIKPENKTRSKNCPIGKPAEAVVIAGTNTFIATSYPYVFITLNGRPLLVLDKDGQNIVIKELHLLDDNGDVVLNITKNRYQISKASSYSINKSSSKITVTDHTDRQFSIYFKDSCSIYVEGIFRAGKQSAIITDKSMIFSNYTMFSDGIWTGGSIFMDKEGMKINAQPKYEELSSIFGEP
jgi:hypothetical protein